MIPSDVINGLRDIQYEHVTNTSTKNMLIEDAIDCIVYYESKLKEAEDKINSLNNLLDEIQQIVEKVDLTKEVNN